MLSDTCYVLSFAIIMLNTSLHNPNVRDKPPVERFISMNRGINEGGDLPEELLRVRIGLWWACVGGDERVTASPHFPLCLPFVWAFPLPQNLYDSIKNEPFKIPEDDGNDLTHTFFNPDREGWLLKLGMCTGVDFSKWESDADISSVKNANNCKVWHLKCDIQSIIIKLFTKHLICLWLMRILQHHSHCHCTC